MRSLVIAAVAALAFAGASQAATRHGPQCSPHAKLCGHRCVPRRHVCHKPTPEQWGKGTQAR